MSILTDALDAVEPEESKRPKRKVRPLDVTVVVPEEQGAPKPKLL